MDNKEDSKLLLYNYNPFLFPFYMHLLPCLATGPTNFLRPPLMYSFMKPHWLRLLGRTGPVGFLKPTGTTDPTGPSGRIAISPVTTPDSGLSLSTNSLTDDSLSFTDSDDETIITASMIQSTYIKTPVEGVHSYVYDSTELSRVEDGWVILKK